MKKRQIIIIIIAIAILAVGKLTMNALSTPAEKKVKVITESIVTVFAQKVKNDTIPVYVQSTGVAEAVNRLELFSEVQGVMEADNGRFKAGNTFNKGDVLVAIRSSDQQAQLFSQRSSFESVITSIMPDLKADYPDEFPAWQNYLSNYSNSSSIADLPEAKSDKLKSFLTGRGIYSNFHSVKNIEIINGKFTLKAPYDGVLIAANVDPGTVIRPGQALGVFIQPIKYELETSTDAITADRLRIGQQVELTMQGLEDKKWNGQISRLVKAIDKNSQMSTFFVSIEADDLKEGMFLQAKVKANEIVNAFELSRSALLENDLVYLVKNNQLILKEVKVEFFNQNTVILTGLNDGDEILTKVPPSAFEGMKVSVYKGDK